MAQTAEGRALTEAHRVRQLSIAARADATARLLWKRLKIADLDGSTPAWLNANVALAERIYRESSAAAAAYVPMYRAAELGTSAGRVVPVGFNAAETRTALYLAGPVRIKLLIGGGRSADQAYAASLTKFTGIMRRQVLSGGRLLIDKTTQRDSRAIGWRRVSDGDPCAFCAMLVSRGPVYASKTKAESMAGSGLRFHGHCGCTAEIIYGDWQPTEIEQAFIDEYNKAALEADAAGEPRTQDTVLWRMRANGGFSDSPRLDIS